ncbi:hypothetical protein FB45DRAFT_1064844 [Roridomyces roridus]|uniref:F-box domain-containing protein n=1 Tax=Roridomyces roridus TaxID=1738132 RepID=A0AAD7FDK8_9AGAR|nr:hypothetical protein FB45DRAFT_1064844 [Roridomyces roridus]
MSGAKLRSRLAQIEEQIASLQSHLTRLQADRQDIIDQLAVVVYPVLTLPHDVTAEIFLRYVHEDDDDLSSTCRPILIASVCALWREVALSNPCLWTRFDITNRSPGAWDHTVDLLRTFISRSGVLPLDLRISLPRSEVLDLVGKHFSRCRSLELEFAAQTSIPINTPVQVPHLTSLNFRGGSSESVTLPPLLDAPRLRELELQSISLLDWRNRLPWSQLTTLRLHQKPLAECLEMVLQTPNLEILELSHYADDMLDEPDESRQHQILARLHTLDFSNIYSYGIIPYLTLPALRDLSVIQPGTDCADILENLMERSQCSPTTLFLSTEDPNDLHRIASILAVLPTISSLKLDCDSMDDVSFEELLELLGSSICPALTSLTLRECTAELRLTSLVDMLQSNQRLTSFKLTVDKDTAVETDGVVYTADDDLEDAVDQLHQLCVAGLKVDIPSKNDWLKDAMNARMLDAPS